ncbi:MAG: T9SS type A sorting domain-containing protein [Salibacteraceae bacterium]
MKNIFFILIGLVCGPICLAQGPFAPQADSAGTTAIHKDSSIVAAWVQNCTVYRGRQHIANSNTPLADVGTEASVYGAPDGDVLSLGDGGYAIIELIEPLENHASFDFAIFENGLVDQSNGGHFLELAFVEVSSDGMNYYRFPNQSLTPTDTQTLPFGYTDATNLYNLAGKYRVNYGTPFDLAEMDTVVGLDINAVTHIKIIDVVGSIDTQYASYDSYGRIVNDPYPTSFGSGGFDIDAVAIVDSSFTTGVINNEHQVVSVYPNPASEWIRISGISADAVILIRDIQGREVLNVKPGNSEISISTLSKGMYFVEIEDNGLQFIHKVLKH